MRPVRARRSPLDRGVVKWTIKELFNFGLPRVEIRDVGLALWKRIKALIEKVVQTFAIRSALGVQGRRKRVAGHHVARVR